MPNFSEKKGLKKQIFEVCQLIYDQQQIAASEMNQIERSLRKLRENFTRQVLKQGGYLNTFEEVDALFENKEGQLKSIRENELLKMKHRNITAKMTQQMMEMELIKAE